MRNENSYRNPIMKRTGLIFKISTISLYRTEIHYNYNLKSNESAGDLQAQEWRQNVRINFKNKYFIWYNRVAPAETNCICILIKRLNQVPAVP